jgi:hypothetical protein
MEENERLREEDKATRKARTDPLEQLIDEEEQRSAAREAARLSRIKAMEDLFYKTARAKVAKEDALKQDRQAREEVNEEDTDNEGIDPGGIYSGQHKKDEDCSYSVHNSEASDGEGKEELGKGASGCSPLLMGWSKPNNLFEEEPFNWLKKIDSKGTFDKKDLLAESTNQTFPCIACNDHKNILDPSTWVPAFLHKLSTTTGDVFNVNFDQTVQNLEWNGDEGLKNLWGLYYKCPDAQFK